MLRRSRGRAREPSRRSLPAALMVAGAAAKMVAAMVAAAALAAAASAAAASAVAAPDAGALMMALPGDAQPKVVVRAGEALPELAPGDRVELAPGRHAGPWHVAVADVTLTAAPGALLDGGGDGSALTLRAPRIRVDGLEIVGVGRGADLYEPDAAVHLLACDDCELEGVRAAGVTAALRIEDSADVRIVDLIAEGTGQGPGVTAYASPGLQLDGVRLAGFLDGLYLERCDEVRVTGATILDSGRYGVHLMFNRGALVERAHAAGGGVGSAVMYGRDTLLRDVRFDGHRGPMAFGLLIQEEHGARVERAELRGNTVGLLIVASPGLAVIGSDFDANGFGAVLRRLPAAFDTGDPDADTTLVIEASYFRRNAFDLALDDDRADVRVLGNAYDRAPPLDLDGDGTLDAPHVVGTSLAALAARQPDLSLLAFGPAIVLWEALEARVPGVRFGMLADPSPRAAAAPHREGSGRTWALTLAPLAGAAWSLRPCLRRRCP
jgi:nitrous oxidase accessory protein